MTDFDLRFHEWTSYRPFQYQTRLAVEGFPELLRVPTGSGKTAAAVLAWLYRRHFHPDASVRAMTPRWLVLALPLRTLIDQVEADVQKWIEAADATDRVGLHVLMGGRAHTGNRWTENPEGDAVIIGSIDMLLSRAMNRGYASGRYRWPIDFGMFNSGAQWVFDEVQLLGPALPTSRQLQAFREHFGTFEPTASMWMSATVAPEWMHTVDAPEVSSVVELGPEDRTGILGERIDAQRHLAELGGVEDDAALAEAIARLHRPGTRTICFSNTVKDASALHKALLGRTPADVVLVHSRFRPPDRLRATERAVDSDVGGAGRIVVTTQAMEAGIDVTSATLVTAAAPWPSLVQRAGRCNRYGETDDAHMWWFEPPVSAPYEDAAVAVSVQRLRSLEGDRVTGEQLAGMVGVDSPHYPVLRKKDIIELFDTTPTLTGDDTDISAYIRDGDDRDVFVAWRNLDGNAPDLDVSLDRSELCRVPIGELRSWLKTMKRGPWWFDPGRGSWVRARGGDVHPAMVLLTDATSGGYTEEGGWSRRSKAEVPPIEAIPALPDAANDDSLTDDRLSYTGQWVTLADHLYDTGAEAEKILNRLGRNVPVTMRRAITSAAALHDIGKAHPAFQELLLSSAGVDEHPDPDTLWAKSSRQRRSTPTRRNLRHELVSAFMIGSAAAALDLPELDLVRYLVGAHHGKVRMAVRPFDSDAAQTGHNLTVMGVRTGDEVPAVTLHDGTEIGATTLDVDQVMLIGGPGSWAHNALQLRDRPDLGMFRLAWMEAVVRLADWRASAHPSRDVNVSARESR